MPIYEYEAVNSEQNCDYCVRPFEFVQKISDPPLARCPRCGAPVRKVVSVTAIGSSRSDFDRRAKEAGFHKLQRTGKGEYEKKY